MRERNKGRKEEARHEGMRDTMEKSERKRKKKDNIKTINELISEFMHVKKKENESVCVKEGKTEKRS